MILVYTGDGKGKTSACLGQALRGLGRGFSVVFAQFMKRDGQAGEQAMLKSLLGDSFRAGGKGFLTRPEQFPEHREAARELLVWIRERLCATDLLILDEALYALGAGLLGADELREIMAHFASPYRPHLVLSGRGLPDWLRDAAHLVTVMAPEKHPYRQGIAAQAGIEF
jgi:cob(I)alamin adenosyltransferase